MVRYRVDPARVSLADLVRVLRYWRGIPYAERVLAGEVTLAPLVTHLLALDLGYECADDIAERIDVQAPPSPSDRAAAQAEEILREASCPGVR